MTTPILLFGLGLLLVAAEALIPSGGILGFAALGAVVASIVTAFQIGYSAGMTFLIIAGVTIPLVTWLTLRVLPRTPVGKLMINEGLSFEASAATDERDLGLIGQTGEVLTPLRPAGHARIGGRRVDVVSRGESLSPGDPVRVVEVRGNRVVVALHQQDAGGPAPGA